MAEAEGNGQKNIYHEPENNGLNYTFFEEDDETIRDFRDVLNKTGNKFLEMQKNLEIREKDGAVITSNVKKPPLKPPRRKHSMRTNQDLKDHQCDSINISNGFDEDLKKQTSQSLDGVYSSPKSLLIESASLPNVKLTTVNPAQKSARSNCQLRDSCSSLSSTDSIDNTHRRKDKKRLFRKSKQISTSAQEALKCTKSKSTQNFSLNTPLVYSSPQMSAAATLKNNDNFSSPSSNNSYPTAPSTPSLENFNYCTNFESLTMFQKDMNHGNYTKNSMKIHKRSNSDPSHSTSSLPENVKNIFSSNDFPSDKLLNIPFTQEKMKDVLNLKNHSSKFSALLEEIYTAQKERDEAMRKRLNLAYKDRDYKIAFHTELKNNGRSSDWEDAIILDRPTNGLEDINANLEVIEKAQSPSEIRKHAKKLLKEVQQAKKYNKKDLYDYIEILKTERNTALEKNEQLQSKLEHYQNSFNLSLNDCKSSPNNNNLQMDDNTEMLRLCYSLHKSVIQDLNSQNTSSVSDITFPSIYQSDESNTEPELSILKRQLETEQKAREIAERKCEKLEMAVNVLRKKVHKMNGFDGFERRFSSSVDYF